MGDATTSASAEQGQSVMDDRRVPWPNGIQCPVVLSFHVDAESIFVDMDPENARRPITVSQGTYGPRLGVPPVLRLLERHHVSASFFVPGISAERHPYVVEGVVAGGHELVHHGYTHRRPDSLSADEEEEELLKGREVLERQSGQKIRGYGSPSWEYSESTVPLLLKHGFAFACDAMDEDIPYYVYRNRYFAPIWYSSPCTRPGVGAPLLVRPGPAFPHWRWVCSEAPAGCSRCGQVNSTRSTPKAATFISHAIRSSPADPRVSTRSTNSLPTSRHVRARHFVQPAR